MFSIPVRIDTEPDKEVYYHVYNVENINDDRYWMEEPEGEGVGNHFHKPAGK